MNTHTIDKHHSGWHWIAMCIEKMENGIHSPKVWMAIAILALLAAFIALVVMAGNTNQTPMPYEYGSPGYPVIP